MNSPTDLNALTSAQQREMLAKLLQAKAAQTKQFPMSVGQQGLWHAYRRDPTSTSFNVFLPTRMRAPLDLEVFRQAIQWVAARHECLHSVFAEQQGQLVQRVLVGLQPDFEQVDLAGASEAQVQAAVSQEASRPFALEQGPLLRVKAYRLADDDWVTVATTHHIVVDFWSLVIILKELRMAYPAFAKGQTPQLPTPQNNYQQFVQDQQRLLSSPQGDRLKSFWQQLVEQSTPVIELPTDRLRPAVFKNSATNTLLDFPDAIVPQITTLAAKTKSTPFVVVHAALQVFLSRYCGQQKFLIGSPFSGRRHQQYEQTVGFFINMLPLQADLEGDPSFAQLIARTSRHLLDALEHEAYPIAQIVHDARIPRDPSRSPLFQVSCTFEKAQLKSEAGRAAFLFPGERQVWDFGGMTQESFYAPHPTCHYDLEFIFEQTDEKLRGMLVASRALYDVESLQVMAQNFVRLLQSLIEKSEVAISRVPWNSNRQHSPTRDPGNAERSNQPIAVMPRGRITHHALSASDDSTRALGFTLPQMIRAAANQHATGVALQYRGRQITYGELVRLATGVALQFEALQVSPLADNATPPPTAEQAIVPIACHSGPLAFIGMLGIQLAGGASACIDLGQPAIDPSRLCDDLGGSILLTDTADLQTALDAAHSVIDLSRLLAPQTPSQVADRNNVAATAPTSAPPTALPVGPTANDVAYLVYTSGSTGKPKGVLVEHASVCNTLRWRQRAVPLGPEDRVLMLLSHQFDAGLGIAWTGLTQGATLIWPDAGAIHDPEALITQLQQDRITVLPAIPSLLRILIAHPRFADCHDLRLVFTGGEAMPAELPSQLRQVTAAKFWNFYGPSEAAIEATACEVTEHSPFRPVPIGYPIDHTRIWVLDAQHHPLPDTVPGELAIAGAGLARGYLGDPELTQRKFIELELEGPGWPKTRAYLTGDRGRRLPDGQLEFLGRTDHQIKLRGYRIELGEIEAVLEAYPTVERAAVQLIDAATPHAQMVAIVSLLKGAPAPESIPAALRRYVSEHLPNYKVPAAVVVVEDMPLTSSGKVDRQRLPDVSRVDTAHRAFVPPATAIEAFVADAWCDILAVKQISVDINFFDAGGSSLQAAMVTSRLSQDLGVHVPTALLFDLADVRQVAIRLAQLHDAKLTERFGPDCISQQLTVELEQDDRNAGAPTGGSIPGTALHPLLAPLKLSGTRPPIFMVHPPGGIVVCYRELARRLSSELPLIAIRARGLHGHEVMPATLSAMAADYVDAIRSVQPRGPYCVGGWSLGGLVAYEMAQQLLQAGEPLSQLILLDTTIPEGSTASVPASELVNVGLEYGIDLNLDQLGELPPEEQLTFLWQHAKGLGVIDDQSPPEVVAQVLEDLQSLFHHHVALARGYQLQPLAGDVTLFRPSESPFELQVSPDRGWRHLAQSVTVHFVPGHHHSMVQPPHVERLAQIISNEALRFPMPLGT